MLRSIDWLAALARDWNEEFQNVTYKQSAYI